MSAGPQLAHEGDPAAVAAPGTEAAAIIARSPLELFWRRLSQDSVALVALALIAGMVLIAVLAPAIVGLAGARPPNEQSTRFLSEFGTAAGPSRDALLGTDSLGRDVFSRVVYGARVSLQVAFIATGIITLLGVTLGMLAGYYRGWVDTVLSRAMDAMLAFPVLLLALGLGTACSLGDGCLGVSTHSIGRDLLIAGAALAAAPPTLSLVRRRPLSRDGLIAWAACGGAVAATGAVLVALDDRRFDLIQPGLGVVIFVIVLAQWPYMARIIRGQVLALREQDYIEAARSLGASDRRILFSHILPNLVAPIVVYSTLLIPVNILFEAALSFLGVGVQPPTASWGAMIADAINIFDTAWWYMTFPGLALLITVLAFNLVGDGLQDALDPRSNR